MLFAAARFFNKWIRMRSCWTCRKQVENILSWVKPCTSDTGPGQVEETIKEQPKNENDLESSTTVTGKLETIDTQRSPPDQVFVNVSDNPQQPKNFRDLRE